MMVAGVVPAEAISGVLNPFRVPDDSLTDDDLTEVVCDGEYYLGRSEDLLDAVAPRCW